MLAIMDMVADGLLSSNRIYFDQILKERFSRNLEKLKQGRDQNNPYQPYFHLVSQSFWHHKVNDQHIDEYQEMLTQHNARGPNIVMRIIQYAYLDEALFEYLQSDRARRLLRAALAENLDQDVRETILNPGSGWSWIECEAIVSDYFEMLTMELSGRPFNKAEHNRKLRESLDGRSRGAVEQKHMNISAILRDMGYATIDGYKPLSNYQREILPDIVGAQIATTGEFSGVEKPQFDEVKHFGNMLARLQDAPERTEPRTNLQLERASYQPRKTNFVEQQEINSKTGFSGEQFILSYEKARLGFAGKDSLVAKIEQVSLSDDSLGFDIKSYEENGKDRFIEVKTTKLTSRHIPFFVTQNELQVSQRLASQYHLYRVYNLTHDPHFFIRSGAIDDNFTLKASSYKATS